MAVFLAISLLQVASEFNRLVESLSSDDISVRESAQKGIEALGAGVFVVLDRRLQIETDPEVRARLGETRRRIEGPLLLAALGDRWEAGDLAGALYKLARWESAEDPEAHILWRKEDLRSALEVEWAPRDVGSSCRFFRPMDRLAARHGTSYHWLIAVFLEEALEKEDSPLRTSSFLYLSEVGGRITPLLVPFLHRSEAFTRQTACILLGNARDERALPELERICRDPEEDPEVRKFACEAYTKCARRPAPELDP
jgi:hypothetical protein